MLPKLRHIWKDGFDDPEEYIELFFAQRFDPHLTRTALCGAKLVAAEYLLPFRVPSGKQGWYIYAGAVEKEYRGKGIFRDITRRIIHDADREGFVLCLYAQPEMRPFYQSMGFTGSIYHRTEHIVPGPDTVPGGIRITKLTALDYEPIRNAFFHTQNSLLWDEAALEYAVRENRFCGGICSWITCGGMKRALIGRLDGNVLQINETTFQREELHRCAGVLCAYFGAASIQAEFPEKENETSGKRKLAVLTKGFPTGKTGWAALTLV